jgi:hypothetical protein
MLSFFRLRLGGLGGCHGMLPATRRTYVVGRNYFAYLIHFGPKFLGVLPELLSL